MGKNAYKDCLKLFICAQIPSFADKKYILLVTETCKYAFDNCSLSFKSRGGMDHNGGCRVSEVQLHTTQLQTPHKEAPASTQIKRDQQSVMKPPKNTVPVN